MKKITESPFLLQFEILSQEKDINHFTTTRNGGVSKPPFASFNLGNYSEDDLAAITENRRRLSEALCIRPDRLIVPKQIHSDKVLLVDDKFLSLPETERSKASEGYDALITRQKGICIGITTADCVPVILYDPRKKVIAAIHAGWKGTVSRIVRATICEMQKNFGSSASDILAGIGPSISRDAFEVGEEVVATFQNEKHPVERIMIRNEITGKAHFDLWKANKLQLLDCGVKEPNIELARICTYTHNDIFFSARREGIKSGRMITGILLL